MGIYTQIDEASFKQLIELWNGEVPSWADSRESLLDEIAHILAQSDAGINFLKRYGQDTDVEKRKSAIYFLTDKRIIDAEILDYLDKAFYATDLKLKTKALWGYIHIEQFPMPRIELEKLVEKNNERISALAIVCLSRAYPTESIQILAKALSSANPRHREYACDEIGDRDITELAPEMKKLLDDTDEYVRQSARCNLEMLGK